jgi:hypothetical protein
MTVTQFSFSIILCAFSLFVIHAFLDIGVVFPTTISNNKRHKSMVYHNRRLCVFVCAVYNQKTTFSDACLSATGNQIDSTKLFLLYIPIVRNGADSASTTMLIL